MNQLDFQYLFESAPIHAAARSRTHIADTTLINLLIIIDFRKILFYNRSYLLMQV